MRHHVEKSANMHECMKKRHIGLWQGATRLWDRILYISFRWDSVTVDLTHRISMTWLSERKRPKVNFLNRYNYWGNFPGYPFKPAKRNPKYTRSPGNISDNFADRIVVQNEAWHKITLGRCCWIRNGAEEYTHNISFGIKNRCSRISTEAWGVWKNPQSIVLCCWNNDGRCSGYNSLL